MLEFDFLLERFLQNKLSSSELKLFLAKANQPVNQEKLQKALEDKLSKKAYYGLSKNIKIDQMFQKMLEKAAKEDGSKEAKIIPVSTDRRYFRYITAAAILLILATGALLLINQNTQQQIAKQEIGLEFKTDVLPGGEKAILTLSDGSEIILDSASNGTLTQQGNTRIIKLANGQLAYKAKGSPNRMLHNTMRTPRGGQYELLMPDGTKVWLNASSSLTYPTAFIGLERKVKLTGEAYFEVAHNSNMPFKVEVSGLEINVLGTHFNVNAYEDEVTTKTTLLEGSVQIKKGTSAAVLEPGQQAQLGKNGEITMVGGFDLEEVIAWKNGLFSFNGADLPTIMRQLSRWYDVEIQYKGEIPKRRFTGQVFRNLKLSEALKVLELNHVHFEIEGKRLTLIP